MVTLKQHGGKHFRLQQMLWPKGFNAAALQSSIVWHASTELCLPSLSTSYPSLSMSPLLCNSVSLCTCEQWDEEVQPCRIPEYFSFGAIMNIKRRSEVVLDRYIHISIYICICMTTEESHLLSLTKSALHRCWGDIILCTVQVTLRSCRTSLRKLPFFLWPDTPI